MSKPARVTSLLGPPDKASAERHRHADLMRTIESQVIPRLMVLHAKNSPRPIQFRITPDHVQDFSNMVLDGDEAMVSAYVEALMLQGASIAEVHLDLIAPTARKLGDMWCTDVCSFADVTIGLGTLQRLSRELAADFRPVQPEGVAQRHALLMPVVGEHHTLGAQMLGEFFRRAGWRVERETPSTEGELSTLVGAVWFDVVGFSLSGEEYLEALTRQVQLVRKHSLNRHVAVLVGGSLFATYPDLAGFVGADASTTDALTAVEVADRLTKSTV